MSIVIDAIDHLDIPTLFCEQCGGPIEDEAAGLFAWAPPTFPKAGYLEARFSHYSCASAYEEARGVELPWRPLSTLWKRSTTNLSHTSEQVERESA